MGIGEYDPRYGTYVGPFSTIWHDVVGDVYAVDNITIAVRGFSYDGEAPGECLASLGIIRGFQL